MRLSNLHDCLPPLTARQFFDDCVNLGVVATHDLGHDRTLCLTHPGRTAVEATLERLVRNSGKRYRRQRLR
jgi:hypothetical protein